MDLGASLGSLLGGVAEPTEEQLQTMLEQVREMFPQMSTDTVLADLRQSGTAQATIENILEGRIGMNGSFMPGALDDDLSDESDNEIEYEEHVDIVQEPDNTRQRTWTKLSSSSGEEDLSYYEVQRAKMIETYRRKYLASDKAADLRAMGITE